MKLLTVTAVEKLKPNPDKTFEVRDAGASGLRLIIHPSGRKTWVLRGRLGAGGKQAKITLGPLDLSRDDEGEPVLGAPLSLKGARILANQLLRQRAKGVDISEAKTKKGDAFPEVVKEFIADHARPRNRTWKSTANVLGLSYQAENVEPVLKPSGLAARWFTKSITEIDGAMIHGAIADSRRNGVPGAKTKKATTDPSNSRGRALAAALGKLFAWATQHRKIEVNPALGMYRPPTPDARSRTLTDAEVKAVWKASDAVGFPFGPVVQLLLLTGQRRDEIAGMMWSELNDDFSILNLPPERTKNKRPHTVPLPPQAREIIAKVPRVEGVDFLFSTTGVTPISGFSKFKRQFDTKMEIAQHWQLHDLRRTAVTGMAELGVLPHVIEAIVNHISGHKGGVAGVYNKAVYAAEKKAALELWANHVGSLL